MSVVEAGKVYSCDNWDEMITATNSGEKFECTEDVFDYFLEVLPPVFMSKRITLPDGEVVKASFGFAEGAETITAFWKSGGKYYGCKTNVMNPYG